MREATGGSFDQANEDAHSNARQVKSLQSFPFCFEKDTGRLTSGVMKESVRCLGQRQVPVQSLRLCSQWVIVPLCPPSIVPFWNVPEADEIE